MTPVCPSSHHHTLFSIFIHSAHAELSSITDHISVRLLLIHGFPVGSSANQSQMSQCLSALSASISASNCMCGVVTCAVSCVHGCSVKSALMHAYTERHVHRVCVPIMAG